MLTCRAYLHRCPHPYTEAEDLYPSTLTAGLCIVHTLLVVIFLCKREVVFSAYQGVQAATIITMFMFSAGDIKGKALIINITNFISVIEAHLRALYKGEWKIRGFDEAFTRVPVGRRHLMPLTGYHLIRNTDCSLLDC